MSALSEKLDEKLTPLGGMVVGAILGGTAVYIWRKIVEKHTFEDLHDEIDALGQLFHDKTLERFQDDLKTEIRKGTTELPTVAEKRSTSKVDYTKPGKRLIIDAEAYENPTPLVLVEEEPLEVADKQEDPVQPTEDPDLDVFEIGEEEYYVNPHEWEQQMLLWYRGDSILADAQDNPVPNAVMLEDVIEAADGDTVYIRSTVDEIEYEINFLDESFGDVSAENAFDMSDGFDEFLGAHQLED